MRSFFVLSFLLLVPVHAQNKPLKALLICGGCCHDYKKQAVILRDGIQARANVQVNVMLSEDEGTNPWFSMFSQKNWAEGYDVIIHDECAADNKDLEQAKNIVAAHKAGLPGVNLHCAMHSFRNGTEIWQEYLGIHSNSHGPQLPIEIDFTDTNHPITKGLKNWTTGNEELYNNVKVFPSAKPLALGHQKLGDDRTDSSVVIWTNDYHGTRVFNTTLGHNNDTVADERYLDLVVRGLLWSCNKMTPAYMKPYKGITGSISVVKGQSDLEKLGAAPAGSTQVEVNTSSTQGGNFAWQAVDGKPESRWCADGASFPQWIQLGFEKETALTGLKIVWEDANRSYRHKIEGSVDGNQWTVLEDGGANETAGNTEVTFKSAKVKFVKVTVSGVSGGGWASIREISAVGPGVGPLFPKFSADEMRKLNDPLKTSGNSTPEIRKLSSQQEAEILKDVTVADGFDMTLFADSSAANYPVYIASAPNGDLYVASDGNGSIGRDANRGRVLRLRDTDGDGRADEVTEFVKSVDSPRGMVWDHDRLYVIHPPDISCFIDRDGDGIAEEQEVLVKGIAFGYADRPADHTTNGLSMGIDGWLYISGGDFGFKEAVGTDGRKVQHRAGGVIRFRPDGSGLEIFSTGTRNILGTPISPLLDIFSRDNTNDGGGWDVRFHHFTGLEDHGYPRMYINFADEIISPLADYGGGSGCGSTYLSEPGFPDAWNHAPLTCDWGTNALWHHAVEPSGATFKETSAPKPLIKMTRPTDADVDGMSAIYQASWKGATFEWEGPNVGYIVRVTPKGYKPDPLPNFSKASDAELIKLLESPSQVRTLEAQRALLRRPGNAGMRDGLLALAGNKEKPLAARVAALYALTQRGIKAENAPTVIAAVLPLAQDPDLQRFVLRALGDAGLHKLPSGKGAAPVAPFLAGMQSGNPRTRLEAIVGATRQNLKEAAPGIAVLLGDSDPVVAHTAFRALPMIGGVDACFSVLDKTSATPEQRLGALRALMRMHQPEVVKGLISRLGTTSAANRQGLIFALARLHFREGEWKGDSWGTRPDTRGPYYQPEPWSETPKIAAVLRSELEKASPKDAAVLLKEYRRNRIESNDTLKQLMALVKKDPAVLADLVNELATVDTVPVEGISYLITAAKGDYPADTIAKAIATLAKTDSKEGCEASLSALAKLSTLKGAERPYENARKAFLTSQKLENHHQLLEDLAEKVNGEVSLWADAAQLNLGARKEGSPESREMSRKSTDRGWQDTKRRAQLLHAIRLIGFRGLDDQVRAAVDDVDATVAKEAKATAAELKLDAEVEDKTPVVGTLSNEQVIELILKTTGDASVGEQLFSRCVACHAVSMDEPQKGPYLGNIAQTYSRAELAENILDPGKTIAQGFATELFTLKDGSTHMGFVTLESAEEVKVRNIAAEEFTWKTADISKREKQPISLMPPGLVNDLTIQGFASLLDYLESLSKK